MDDKEQALNFLYDIIEKVAAEIQLKPIDVTAGDVKRWLKSVQLTEADGAKYASIREAARQLGVADTTIRHALKRGGKVVGKTLMMTTRDDLRATYEENAALYGRLGGFQRLRDAHFLPSVPTAERLENRKLQNKSNQARADYRLVLDNQMTLDNIQAFADKVFSGRIQPVNIVIKKGKTVKRYIHALWSDLHYGSDLRAETTGAADYGVVEEARRTAKFVEEIVSYKHQYRDQTQLKLLLGGDIIQNALHDPRDGDIVARQVCRAIHLLSQVVAHCAAAFPQGVDVYCVTGNHGRNTGRHHGRATKDKGDSWETVIYYALKMAAVNLKNVTFHIPMTPYAVYDAHGKMFLSHGDTVFNPGNIGGSINIKSLADQANRINASLPDKQEYKAFIFGHTHEPLVKPLSNGSWLIGNGALLPPDDYAVSLGIMEAQSGQWIWEGVEGHPIGDARFVTVDRHTDSDVALDKIVKPWDGF